MKSLALFCFLDLMSLIVSGQNKPQNRDSAFKKPALFITAYPSAIITGDIAFGAEFNSRYIRQELAFFYKTFNTPPPNYYFNRGLGANYYLKYNLIRAKKHLFSIDIGYLYLDRRFNYKAVITSSNEGKPSDPTRYRMNKREVIRGPGFGISHLSRLGGKWYFGSNIALHFVQKQRAYITYEYVSGPPMSVEEKPHEPMPLPYVANYTTNDWLLSLLVKIAYRL